MNPRVVIGGGICGLIAAWSLQRRYPDSPVIILERAPELGGLLSGLRFPSENLYFDQGTHIFQETGDPAIDGFIRAAIPPAALVLLPEAAADLAGAIYSGRLQTNSHFPDIRRHPDYPALREALQQHVAGDDFTPEFRRDEPLVTVAQRRFGRRYADTVLLPLLASLYQIEPATLAAFALLLPGLTRVVALDEAEWRHAAADPARRAIFAIPDQRRLPPAFRHGRRSFYTNDEGARGVIKALEKQLLLQGVSIRKNTVISQLDPAALTITQAGDGQPPVSLRAESIFISTGVVGAARLMQLEPGDFGLDRPMLHRVVHLLLDQPVDCDLHYIYGLDPVTCFYRITHYRGFSSVPADRRLSVEVLGRAEITDAELPTRLIQQMQACGFLQAQVPVFAHVQRLPQGFPIPTLKNMAGIKRLQEHLLKLLPGRIQLGGAGSGDGSFFTNETVINTHAMIQRGGTEAT